MLTTVSTLGIALRNARIRGLLFKFVDFPYCSFNTAFIQYQRQYYEEVMSSCLKNASFFKKVRVSCIQMVSIATLVALTGARQFFEQSQSYKALKNKPTIRLKKIRIDAKSKESVAI